jgi:tetratricopeptide (TPR) repeat protein/predicted Ser/Thr protein kinase
VNVELYQRARAVFVDSIELPDGERDAFVEKACAGDPDLRAEVASLLDAHRDAHGFDSVAAAAERKSAPPIERIEFPAQIGRYRILEQLGQGGMGVVYLAEQENPRRKVALKVLHAGIISPLRARRFEREAEILGRLHHPGIAQVFEAGAAVTESGAQPFLAMELVEGRTLTDHADALGLGTRARIELLVRVCHAVHHAHDRGVVHRDLKPANILVDEGGQPKVLDFGIAHATAEDLRARTLVTGLGEVLGTLPYMSPEQLAGTGEADARSDVYALGVIGYELLSGRLPIDLRGKSLPEAAQMIREDEPPLLGSLARGLRGDLETIFAKALEKERDRRYASALALAADLERWLREQPIEARPPSTMYQLSKFARRNRVLVGGVVAVFLTLVLGIVGTMSQAQRATRQKDDALAAKSAAERESKRARVALRYLQGMFETVDPNVTGRNAKLIDAVDDVARDLATAFPDDPLSEASMQHVLGVAYAHMGSADESERHLTRAIELRRAGLGPDHPDTEIVECDLAELILDARPSEAEAILTRILARQKQDPSVGIDRSVRPSALLAKIHAQRQHFDEASALLEKGLEIRRNTAGDVSAETVEALRDLGLVRMQQARFPEAAALFRDGLRIQDGLPHAKVVVTLELKNDLASALRMQGDAKEAELVLRDLAKATRERFGPDDLRSLISLSGLAVVLHDQGRIDESAQLDEQVLDGARRAYGDKHPLTLSALENMAKSRRAQKRYADARAYQSELVGTLRETQGDGSWETLDARCDLALLLQDEARTSEAEEIFRDVVEKSRGARFTLEWDHAWFEKYRYGCFLMGIGDRYADAEPLLLAGYDGLEAGLGEQDPRTIEVARQIATLYTKWNKPEEAERWQAKLAPGH